MGSVLAYSFDIFTHILQDCFTHTGTIPSVPMKHTGKTTSTSHNKAKQSANHMQNYWNVLCKLKIWTWIPRRHCVWKPTPVWISQTRIKTIFTLCVSIDKKINFMILPKIFDILITQSTFYLERFWYWDTSWFHTDFIDILGIIKLNIIKHNLNQNSS